MIAAVRNNHSTVPMTKWNSTSTMTANEEVPDDRRQHRARAAGFC